MPLQNPYFSHAFYFATITR